jgi:hypothetical protein
MAYRIHGYRLLVVLLLLAAGMFIATLLSRPEWSLWARGSRASAIRRTDERRRVAIAGMLGMTVLGLASGVAGGLAEGAFGQTLLVQLSYAVYRVCWAPAFVVRDLQLALLDLGIAGVGGELPGLLALMLIPVTWFLVFLGAGHLLER